ncbi:uridine kinase [Bacilli bacterium PM5-3]|nr:uridine kinase [Bacilli bacterium PM5-3]MDH6603495.1 uridine kinase [Bacilli bacterium PM5-9]
MKKPLLIGIAGGSASGKSSVARIIYEHFHDTNSVYILKQDDYYKDKNHLSLSERKAINYDHPLEFDIDLMIKQLSDLSNNRKINKPVYDFSTYLRTDLIEEVLPTDVIIVEGLFALENEDLRNLYDLKIFVDTDSDIRLIRRIMRDVNERERSLESIVEQYQTSVRDMHISFVEPTKRYADVIILNGKENVKAIDLIITKIASILD